MKDLILIACRAGFQDGLNPCIFMTCAVFIAQGFWLKKRSLHTGWLRFIFGLVYVFNALVCNFGPGQIIVLQKNFIFSARIIYFLLGLWAFISGVFSLKEWYLLRIAKSHQPQELQGTPVKNLIIEKIKSNPLVLFLFTVMLATVLSTLSTLWPINNYILILGNEALLKGQWQQVAPMLVTYVFFTMWALWFVWLFLSIKNLSAPMLKITCAAIFLTASSTILFLFK